MLVVEGGAGTGQDTLLEPHQRGFIHVLLRLPAACLICGVEYASGDKTRVSTPAVVNAYAGAEQRGSS